MTARWSVPTPGAGGSEQVIEEILRQITAAIRRAAVPPRAIGVSCLGHIDQDTGSVHYAPRPPGFTRLPLGTLLAERFALPVSVVNDANAAALAEWRLGAGHGTDNFCFVTVSTGIGCGLIINGRVLSGRLGGGGELGRVRLPGPAPAGTRLEDRSHPDSTRSNRPPSRPPRYRTTPASTGPYWAFSTTTSNDPGGMSRPCDQVTGRHPANSNINDQLRNRSHHGHGKP